MCLDKINKTYTENGISRTCYKVFSKPNNTSNFLEGAYYGCYNLSQKRNYTIKDWIFSIVYKNYKLPESYLLGFHGFKTLHAAKKYKSHLNEIGYNNLVIYKVKLTNICAEGTQKISFSYYDIVLSKLYYKLYYKSYKCVVSREMEILEEVPT